MVGGKNCGRRQRWRKSGGMSVNGTETVAFNGILTKIHIVIVVQSRHQTTLAGRIKVELQLKIGVEV